MPSGTKSFILNYRPGPGGRKAPNRRIVIGRCGAITPDQARRMAQEMLGRVAAGDDPAAERARARAMPTLRQAFEEYLSAGPAAQTPHARGLPPHCVRASWLLARSFPRHHFAQGRRAVLRQAHGGGRLGYRPTTR